MKTEETYLEEFDLKVYYYIGRNAKDNFNVIDMGEPHDLWFHANNLSSCHVVACPCLHVDRKLTPMETRKIIYHGALLCKQNTQKLISISNVPIIYTELRNVRKTKTLGCVMTENTKTIII